MKFLSFVTASAFLILGVGCRKSSEFPAEVPVDQATAEVKSAFATAPVDVKRAADEAAQEMASGNYPASYGRLDELSSRPDLTPEQRSSLAESQLAVMKKISEAAAAGDEAASKALEIHRARK